MRVGFVDLALGLALDDATGSSSVEGIAEGLVVGARLNVGATTYIGELAKGNAECKLERTKNAT